MWCGGVEQLVWLQVGAGWRCLAMEEGVCQGGCSALQDFALGFRRAQCTVQLEVAKVLPPTAESSTYGIKLFVDDQSLRVRRHLWRPVLGAVGRGLAAHGLRLRPDKNKAHCPAAQLDPQLEAELTSELQGFASYEPAGLIVLGTVADGDYAMRVVADGVDLAPVRKRAQQAEQLAAALGA
eukprot:10682720-Alexandrium_andersonii.AAC.1